MSILSEHPNVLQLKEVLYDTSVKFSNGSQEIIKCSILEYAENGTLSRLVRKNGVLDECSSCFIFNQILSAIKYMHELNIAHCDIKPQNILLDKFFNAKVSDFGVSTIITTENGKINTRKGTKGYMAPELLPLQRDDAFDPKASDIYALGATLAFIACGEQNFQKLSSDNSTTVSGDLIDDDSDTDIFSKSDISEELKDLIRAMLAPNPEDRPTISEIECHPWVQEGFYISPEYVYSTLSEL